MLVTSCFVAALPSLLDGGERHQHLWALFEAVSLRDGPSEKIGQKFTIMEIFLIEIQFKFNNSP